MELNALKLEFQGLVWTARLNENSADEKICLQNLKKKSSMGTLSIPLGNLTTEELGWLSLTRSVHQKALYEETYLTHQLQQLPLNLVTTRYRVKGLRR